MPEGGDIGSVEAGETLASRGRVRRSFGVGRHGSELKVRQESLRVKSSGHELVLDCGLALSSRH